MHIGTKYTNAHLIGKFANKINYLCVNSAETVHLCETDFRLHCKQIFAAVVVDLIQNITFLFLVLLSKHDCLHM